MNRRIKWRTKLEIYQLTSARYHSWYWDQERQGGSCLYWSLALMGVLIEHGYRPLIQAGSMSWPIAEKTTAKARRTFPMNGHRGERNPKPR